MRAISLLLCLGLLTVLLCGCGEQPPAASDPPEVSTSHTETGDGYGLPYADEGVFDPLTTENALNIYLTPLVYRSLFVREADMALSPSLASDYSLEGSNVRVTLRGDTVFHNGVALTAEDVVYSCSRILKGDNPRFADLREKITAVRAEGQNTLLFTLAEGVSSWMDVLTFPIVRKGTGVTEDAVGCGDYALRTSEGKRYLSAVGGESSLQDLPFSRIELVPVKSISGLVDAFEAGRVDCMAADVLSWESFMPVCTYSVQSAPTGLANILLFNTENALLSDASLRGALSALLPREELCAGPLLGAATASQDWMYGGVPCVDAPAESEAKEILASAGFGGENPVRFTLLYCNDRWQRGEEARRLADWLSGLGAECELRGLESGKYEKALEKGDFDLAIVRRPLRDAEELAALCTREGAYNFTGYRNDEMEAELRVLRLSERDTAAEAEAEVSRMLSEDTPFAVIGYENIRVYFRDGGVSAFSPLPDCPYGNPARWRIDE
ncbi:MAG: ABC transporter substrate-binding protein [Clostridia bacterium]|nr:ABC transporter substrate-binding protein [Clostridia bacterium]